MPIQPFDAPTLRADLPLYPPSLQLLRVTGGTVPGPSGYASSSVLGPSVYVASTQQLHPTTLLPRDREPCFALDVNRYGLSPGYYLGRLAGSYQSLPVYEVGGSPLASPAFGMTSPPLPAGVGVTPAQLAQLSTFSPAQMAVLSNLTPCQLTVLLTSLPPSDVYLLTTGVFTPTQLSIAINQSSTSQFTALYQQLTTSQIILLTTALNQQEVYNFVQVLTPPQIQTLTATLTIAQLRTLATLPAAQLKIIVPNFTTAQLITFLTASPLPDAALLLTNTQTGTSYTITAADLKKLITISNALPIAISLPGAATLGPGWTTAIQNIGAGAATITPVTGTINGAASLAIPATNGAVVVSDGTNWQVSTPVAGATLSSGGGTRTEGTLAATGSAQGDAAAITVDSVDVTGADGTKGVILPGATAAAVVVVQNNESLSQLKVYPPSGGQLGSLPANTSITMAGGEARVFYRVLTTKWRYSGTLS